MGTCQLDACAEEITSHAPPLPVLAFNKVAPRIFLISTASMTAGGLGQVAAAIRNMC